MAIVENHFAPNLIKSIHDGHGPEHPCYIYLKMKSKESKVNIYKKLMSWIDVNRDSAYLYTAIQISDKLKVEIDLEKEVN